MGRSKRRQRDLAWGLGLALCFAVICYLVIFPFTPFGFRKCSNCVVPLTSPGMGTAAEQIDIVYTWVNGSDPKFIADMRKHGRYEFRNRFKDHGELKYSLRSLEKFAPWVNRVFLVTNGQIPDWLNTSRVTVIPHDDFFPPADLPTFSSPAIEANLFRIKKLSNRFLYFNDDMFLASPVTLEDFVANHKQKIYLSWDIPDCAPGCADDFLGDDYCDMACNLSACGFDLGDCTEYSPLRKRPLLDEGQEEWEDDPMGDERVPDTCGREECLLKWVGDGICDSACREVGCGFDGGDCTLTSDEVIAVYDSKQAIHFPLQRWWSVLIKFDGEAVSPQQAKLHNSSSFLKLALPVEKWDGLLLVGYVNRTTEMMGTGDQVHVRATLDVLHEVWSEVPLLFDLTPAAVTRPVATTPDFESPDLFANSELPDLFAQSLTYSKRTFHRMFAGQNINHKVPAHVPHLIDKSVFARLHAALPQEFSSTSAHQFRHAHDMQFAYSYYTYFMAEHDRAEVDDAEVWSLLDTDRNGCLDANEFRTMVARILSQDVGFARNGTEEEEDEEGELPEINAQLLLAAYEEIWKHSWDVMGGDCLSMTVMRQCKRAFTALQRHAHARLDLNGYEIVMDTASPFLVTFVMLGDDPKQVLRQLDSIRVQPTKFVCINDDTTAKQTAKQALQVDLALLGFFESMFPLPSQFELVEGGNAVGRVSAEVDQWPYAAMGIVLLLLMATAVFAKQGIPRHHKRG